MKKLFQNRFLNRVFAVLLVISLTACGGSSSGSSSGSSGGSGGGSSSATAIPTANAGKDLSVSTGEQIELTGESSVSNATNKLLTYSWKLENRPSGSEATLKGATTVNPTFIADLDGEYTVKLIVNNGESDSEPAFITISASTTNSAPIADAGKDQTVRINTEFLLDASGSSDADGDELTYSWSLKDSPSLSEIKFDWFAPKTKKEIKVNPDAVGFYVFELVVNDGRVKSEPSQVTVTVDPLNSIPIANAGEKQMVLVGSEVELDGNASVDADGDKLDYLWAFKSKPEASNAELDNVKHEEPKFVADTEGDYVVSLVVNDGEDDSSEATVTIKAKPPHLRIFEKSGSFRPVFNEATFPVNVGSTIMASVSGVPAPTSYTVGTFKLQAFGGDFTIVNISAVDSTNTVTPFFKSLFENQVVTDGSEIEFELVSPLTKNKEVNLTFEFTVLEASETFKANYRLTTN